MRGEVSEEVRRASVESENDFGHPSSKRLLLKMANDYSGYLKTDLSFQIARIEEFTEESLAKMEEFRSLLEMKDNERKVWLTQTLPDLIRTGTLLSITLHQRLDTLSALILSIQTSLDVLEGHISHAESKLGLASHTTAIKSVFTKYFHHKGEESTSDHHKEVKGVRVTPTSTPTFQQLSGPDPIQLSQFFH